MEKGHGDYYVPKKAGLLRCGKSCRLRWINYLREDIKRGNISAEEDDVIIKLHSSFGNRWSLIAGYLPGRTDNEIKNYWNSHMIKRIRSFTRPTNKDGLSMPVDMGVGKIVGGCKRRGGRTSRSAMKNNLNLMELGREKQHGKSVTPNLLQLLDKEAQTWSCQNEGRESMALGPSEDRETGGFGPYVGLKCGILSCPNEGMGSMGLATNEKRNSGERENGNLGTNEAIVDEFLCPDEGIDTPNEESEGGVVDANKDRESEVMGASDERRE